jgi:hypothetical protein
VRVYRGLAASAAAKSATRPPWCILASVTAAKRVGSPDARHLSGMAEISKPAPGPHLGARRSELTLTSRRSGHSNGGKRFSP